MIGACGLIFAICSVLSIQVNAARLRFPGPVLQQQEAAPYPPAGLTPDPPFELPTEQAANYPEPDLTYGPPDEVYGPPDEVYGPPDEVYGPPDNTYGPPTEQVNVSETYLPPQSSSTSESLVNLASLRPQAQLVLPLVQRFAAFRQVIRPVQAQRRPAKLITLPQRRPAQIINANKAVFPATQLTLPFSDRRIPFRPQRLVVNAPLKRRPARVSQFTLG
ncbi:pollen-specific leucine-rich repeat extensin-like protein 2 [Drosophila busckii]|uniref:pollen-specific leucine-rich repeat extensin-like protein 2 n=1 Tax=Drosophila busckii TaxID=30019 RepID=UPI00143332FA|nr:pollen-specific leucine-rich repeat extensin-like protein 2 [Drosophila busckii]